MRGGGQDQHLGTKGDKVDLQDVIFKMIMDIHMMAGQIRGNSSGEYQRNADNFMYQIMTLEATVDYMISDKTHAAINRIIGLTRRMYVALKKRNGGSVVSIENQDEVMNIAVLSTNLIFKELCNDLHRKGYLAEQRKGVIVGKQGLLGDVDELDEEDAAADEAELNEDTPVQDVDVDFDMEADSE